MVQSYLTKEGYEKMLVQLDLLKKQRRVLSEAIGVARGHGDLSENADYDAAKEAQGLNEKRIYELEQMLSTSKIVDYANVPTDRVLVGATVKLKDLDTKDEVEYTLTTPDEMNFAEGKISIASPLAQGLIDHKIGEEVSINVPAGLIKFKILDIYRK